MKLGRIFANAIARRVAYVLVAMALAWLGIGDARAEYCLSESEQCSQPQAFSQCSSRLSWYKSQFTGREWRNDRCDHVSNTYQSRFEWRPVGGTTWNTGAYAIHWYSLSKTCSAQPSSTFAHDIAIPTGSSGCANGCEFDVYNNGDGTYTRYFNTAGNVACNVLPSCDTPGWYLNHATSMCQPPEEECPGNQTKNPKTKQCEEACPTGMVMDPTGACKPSAEECPAGNVRAPSGQCLPGEGQCAAGEARRPNGTCGRDSDGDGQADEDDEDPENDPDRETASGGDSCNAPPSCSGGPIMCLQAKIQWRIDCNTRKNINVSGGTCGAIPVCTGDKCDALQYSQLLMQWRTACALEKLEIPGAGEGGDGETIKPDFEAFAGTSDGANPDDSIFLPDGDAEGFNQSLISYGAGALGWNFSVEGQQFALPQQITDFIAVLRWLIIAAATLVGIAIAWGRS